MSSPTITPATLPPMLFPDDAPRVRSTDPLTSSAAADTSVSRETVPCGYKPRSNLRGAR